MNHLSWRRLGALLVGVSLLALPASGSAQEKSKTKPALTTGHLHTADWLKASDGKLKAGEIDRLILSELEKAGQKPSPLISDETFVRRVYLDVTGKLPVPADVTDFLKDKNPNRRARLVDKLLDSPDYAHHWAVYWRGVISSRTTDLKALQFVKHFEKWLGDQFQENKSWSSIVREIVTATGDIKQDEPDKNGQAYFLGSRFGNDAATELAAETSRIFLGIQIQCAQCHDHPSDVWKREQFHEFAAYFARFRERPIRDGNRFTGQTLVSLPFGEHQMPGKDNPKNKTSIQPKFLDGKSPGRFLKDASRRDSLAKSMVSKENPWFAGAYVNRIWGELMGQAFYTPVDDMGPEKEATMPAVIARVAAGFRASDYDVKDLFRAILNSETYQREVRPGESTDDHLLFAGRSPTRLNADALWNSLANVLGTLSNAQRAFGGPGAGAFGRFASFEGTFKQEFSFDPSTKPEEVEGSITQALILMNNPQINQKIQAKGSNLLGRILQSYTSDDEALRMVYLKAMARRPTDRELAHCKQHIARVNSRAEAYEDILWALINSTEFLTKR